MKNLIIVAIVCFFIVGCAKEEIPISMRDPGEVITQQIAMTASYQYQLFFDLESQSVVSMNDKSIWDLGFETSAEGWHVVLNSAKFMSAWRTSETQLGNVTDTVGANWKYDAPSGNLDSTAIGDWTMESAVYVIDRGFNPLGMHMGYAKMILQSYDDSQYTLLFDELSGSNPHSYTVNKNEHLNFVSFSLQDEGYIVQVEPNKADWDLMFTQYTHYFNDEDQQYLVAGVLSNPYQTEVAKDYERYFTAITRAEAENYEYSNARNAIGFDWKVFDFDEGSFLILDNRNYVVKTSNELLYKLRFTDFYNELGEKGHPTFEFQQL